MKGPGAHPPAPAASVRTLHSAAVAVVAEADGSQRERVRARERGSAGARDAVSDSRALLLHIET